MKKYIGLGIVMITGLVLSCTSATKPETEQALTDTIPLPAEVTAKKIVRQRTQTQEALADSLLQVANEVRMTGEEKKAIPLYEKITENDPYNIEANKLLVNLYINQGAFTEALAANKKVLLTGNPTYRDYVQSGLLLEVLNKPGKAASYYKQAQILLKQNEQAYWKKVDTLGMASMLIEVRDTVRGVALIETMIANRGMDETQKQAFINFGKKSHSDKINRLKALLKE